MIDSGRTIAEVSRELGIDAGMLSVWVKDERRRVTAAEVHGDKPLEAAERAELLRLRGQVTELEESMGALKGEQSWMRAGANAGASVVGGALGGAVVGAVAGSAFTPVGSLILGVMGGFGGAKFASDIVEGFSQKIG
ncbi:hypothetical protein [Amycolatopsis sp. CA-230715]|uniref:hypothetical protein n=1 Tax=Amycolatopsis sp. CA-230715 TaxID=2745196 RepID=UPI001C321981|nr:hypothetical protein [Amycolatopsis sp. CA-230715]QWF76819.1 hypothetical protein HUW46_00198 [Amycolatopsis sp. CA-230715]